MANDIVVRGPLEMPAREGQVCDHCGVELETGSPVLMGRIAGRHVHVCGDECFEAICSEARSAA